jgi:hypothetical protein
MGQRSLHAVTKVYYMSMSYFATTSATGLACRAKVFSPQAPLPPGGLDESPCQFPLLRARHTTYTIPN